MYSPSRIRRENPKQAWAYLTNHPDAVLIDVRTQVEYTHVGHPIGAILIPWQEAPDWVIDPHFVDKVIKTVPSKSTSISLLCRSGNRSMEAAIALEAAGFVNLVNIEEGFEGSINDQRHRGTTSGWRFHGLPWEQS